MPSLTVQNAVTEKPEYTPEFQREVVKYRLRAQMEFTAAAMELEADDSDFEYIRNIVVRQSPVLALTVPAAFTLPTTPVFSPLPIPISGINAGPNTLDLTFLDESMNSLNPPPRVQAPPLKHRYR